MQLNWQKLRGVSKKKILAGTLIFILIVSVVAINLIKNRNETGIPVKTALVENKPLQDNVFASGRVRLVEKQEFYTYNETTVRKINVAPGDRVHKGQVLGLLDAADFEDKYNSAKANYIVQESNLNKAVNPRAEEVAQERAAYRKAQADYHNAQKEYDRIKYLFEQGAVSARELEQAELQLIAGETGFNNAGEKLKIVESGPTGHELEALRAQVDQARIQMELAERQLNRNILKAEMDGTVITVEVAEGDHVEPGTRLIVIGNTGQVEVSAGVSETDSGRLKIGQKAKVTAAALPDQEYTGVLQSVSPGAVVKTGNQGSQIEVPITVRIVGDAGGLRPGYTVDLAITTVDRDKALVVPYEAVVEKDGVKKVFVVENKTAKVREIKAGINTELFTEIISGLREGETVILNPGDKLKDGSLVQELKGQPPAAGGEAK